MDASVRIKVPRREYRACGFTGKNVHFSCLDPIAWLKDPKLNLGREMVSGRVKRVKLPRGIRVFLRNSELRASYLEKRRDIVPLIASELDRRYHDVFFMVKRRYNDTLFGDLRKIWVLTTSDIHPYLASSRLLVGGGGTFNIEGGYYGIPTLYWRSRMASYERWMIGKGLGFRARRAKEGVELASKVLEDPSIGIAFRKRARRVFRDQRFPVKEICDRMEKEIERHAR